MQKSLRKRLRTKKLGTKPLLLFSGLKKLPTKIWREIYLYKQPSAHIGVQFYSLISSSSCSGTFQNRQSQLLFRQELWSEFLIKSLRILRVTSAYRCAVLLLDFIVFMFKYISKQARSAAFLTGVPIEILLVSLPWPQTSTFHVSKSSWCLGLSQ